MSLYVKSKISPLIVEFGVCCRVLLCHSHLSVGQYDPNPFCRTVLYNGTKYLIK